ncbi:baseplate J/gp47 family protein [Bacillus stercoris]|nr:baseplate J/gp47 family protein [Bacillus stercoris]
MKKSREEILNDLDYRLRSQTDITNTDPGSVARTFLEVLTEEFYEFYDELDLAVSMGFVSTATGSYLDLIGALLDCKRNPGEDDENYRSRIISQVYVVAGANLTSIRLKALSVEGVNDVKFKQYSHGAGSFTCYVITSDPQASRDVLDAVQAVVDDTKAYGVYAEVTTPVLIPVELMVRLIFSSDAGTTEKNTIRQGVIKEVRQYVDNLELGETLIINELIQRIMDVSTKIKDTDIYGLNINNVSQYVTNVTIKADEKFILDSLDIT